MIIKQFFFDTGHITLLSFISSADNLCSFQNSKVKENLFDFKLNHPKMDPVSAKAAVHEIPQVPCKMES